MAAAQHDSYRWQARRKNGVPVDAERFAERMAAPGFPLSSQYDPAWVYANAMGPNALWLAEYVHGRLGLQSGQRLLDLGCGTAMTSIFLARELGVWVCAADQWIAPHDNWPRIVEAGLQARVLPLQVEAHALPFAHDSFDAIVSLDAYHYFGTDERYLPYLVRFLRPGGTLAIVVPGNAADPETLPADQATGFAAGNDAADFFTFRSAEWWRRLWTRSGAVQEVEAGMIEDGWELWLRCLQAGAALEGTTEQDHVDGPLLLASSGRSMGFTWATARRPE